MNLLVEGLKANNFKRFRSISVCPLCVVSSVGQRNTLSLIKRWSAELWLEDTKAELSEQFSEQPAVQRVLPRFALILMTGILAVQTGVLPYTEEDVINAVNIAIEAWLEAFEAPSDVERAVVELRAEMITNAHRIIHIEETQDNSLKPFAYRDDQYVYMTDEHIKAITSHVSVNQIAKALNEKKSATHKRTQPSESKKRDSGAFKA